ncbi:tRNA (N(6)-L-threonylcarbamoyladenosine(37)-C(2))-methylthiotransferase [Thermoplasma sp.]|uniref:tRNA (N(6)-L-threonylcarbamoyladenosine(37)-C(2))- methylthiotransferase n=1 Tax=Thermoplasma sp. TaxID=1973142 RepID=UPI00127C3FED|nr:tRNA (N(6)-L-threonylcarbamoyladenosine(37)-C(2))-methylthiotransferase [Thermoplasma sp.]KAA8922101.1 MAG: tRNA (N(6)-L-threonylcarbamoyladenosine(37)-C(2))-methylthiotransferase [Thermoplasma sp.]
MKIYYEGYGCTLNQGETGLYVNRLLSDGSVLVSRPEDADLSIIGTCAVIKKTEDHMMRRIEELSRYGRVRVIGCLSAIKGREISGGNIEAVDRKQFQQFQEYLDDTSIVDAEIMSGIPINQGCTGRCNFCISHIARGKLVSRKPEKIANQVKMIVSSGKKEIRISSLDTAAYGKDTGYRLPSLIKDITSIDGDFMLRVGMMEPRNTMEILDGLLEAYDDPKVFKFLHIPVQSGDDDVLRAMNREYTVDEFLKIVRSFRKRFPDMTLSTDVIIGYHAETDRSFDLTCDLIEEIKPEIVNVTRFSPRELTPDFEHRPRPTNLLKEQDRRIAEIHGHIVSERFSALVGKVERVLITEIGKPGTMVGRDSAYRPVIVEDSVEKYSWHSVRIIGFENASLIGSVID